MDKMLIFITHFGHTHTAISVSVAQALQLWTLGLVYSSLLGFIYPSLSYNIESHDQYKTMSNQMGGASCKKNVADAVTFERVYS